MRTQIFQVLDSTVQIQIERVNFHQKFEPCTAPDYCFRQIVEEH